VQANAGFLDCARDDNKRGVPRVRVSVRFALRHPLLGMTIDENRGRRTADGELLTANYPYALAVA